MRKLMRGLLRIKVRPYYIFHCDPVIGAGHFRTSIWKGMEIMEGLRGHMSGLGIPTYVVDSPHGGGKVPVMPNYVVSASDDAVVLRNYEGMLVRYQAEDKPLQSNDQGRTRGVSSLLQGSKSALIPENAERMIRRQMNLATVSAEDASSGCSSNEAISSENEAIPDSLIELGIKRKFPRKEGSVGVLKFNLKPPGCLLGGFILLLGSIMKIGIVCNLKSAVAKHTHSDDFEEEFDSPETMHAIGAVLATKNHQIVYFAESPDLPAALIKDRPDFVFNFAEGRGTSRAREARVPALLEILGIPYSGSDPFTLCVGLDKDVAKK